MVELSAILAIFESNNYLFLNNTVTLLDTDPCNPSGNLRSHLDFVMRNDVTGRDQYSRVRRGFGTRANGVHYCGGCGPAKIEDGQQTASHQNQCNENDPSLSAPIRLGTLRFVDLELFQLV